MSFHLTKEQRELAFRWRETGKSLKVITPGTRDVEPSFVPVAKHYGAVVEPCPPRRGYRKVRKASVRAAAKAPSPMTPFS